MIRNFTQLNNIGKFINPPQIAGKNFSDVTIIFGKNTYGKSTITKVFRSIQNNDPLILKEKKTIDSSGASLISLGDENNANYIFNGRGWSDNVSSLDIEIFDSAFVDKNLYSGEKIMDDHHENLNNLIIGETGVIKQKQIDALTAKINQNGREKKKMSIEFNEKRAGCALDELIKINITTQDIDSEIERRVALIKQIENYNAISIGLNVELNKISLDFNNYRVKLLEKLSVDIEHIKKHLEAFSIREGRLKFIKDGINYQKSLDKGSICVLCGQRIDKESADHFANFQKFFNTRYQIISEGIKNILEDFKNTNIELSLTNIINICEKNKIPCLLKNDDILKFTLRLNEVQLDINNKYQNLDNNFNFSNFEEIEIELKKIIDFIKSIILKLPTQTDLPRLNMELRNLSLEKNKKENWLSFCEKYQKLDEENVIIQEKRTTLISELDAEMDQTVSTVLEDLNQNLLDLGADFSIFKLEHRRKIRTADKSLYSLLFKSKVLPLIAERGDYCFNNILSDSDRKVLALAFFLATVNKNTIVVFDDPVSSFDNERKRAITKKIGELKQFVKQIIILTHDEGFLREINWEPNLSKNCFMIIENNGATSFLENSCDIKDYIEDNHKKRIKRLIKMQSTGNFENNFEAECRKLMEHVFELKHHSELIGARKRSIRGYAKIIFNSNSVILNDFSRLGNYLHVPLHDGSIPETGEIDNQTTFKEFLKCLKYI